MYKNLPSFTITACILTLLTPLICSFSFFNMGELKKFNCKTQSIKPNPEGLNPREMNRVYYNYIKDKKKIEVVWDGAGGKSIVGTYNTYEKEGKLYWGKKDRPIWGGTQYHSLLTIKTMKLKTNKYDNKGVLIQEIDDLCKRGW